MHLRRLALLSVLALLATGCPPPDDTEKPDDTSDDTGDSGPLDEGCITVDGKGGYAWLNDAIRVAQEGSTIEVCEGDFEEAVVVNKPVVIVGAGISLTRWSAPANEPAFLFDGVTGASLSGMDVVSTRSGVEVSASTEVTLADLSFVDIPNYAIDAEDSTSLLVRASAFTNSQWGAVRAQGGSAAVEDCSFIDNLGFAIKAMGGADLYAARNAISGTMYTKLTPEGKISDGFAIFLDEAGDAALEENALVENPIVGLFAVGGGAVALTGDSIQGGIYGIYQVYGDLTLQDVVVTNPTDFGVLYAGPSGERIAADGLQITGEPDLVANYAWDEGVLGSIGLYVEADDVEVTNSTLQGYNSFGAYMVPSGDGGTVVLDAVSFLDNGRRGLLTSGLDVTASNLTVSGLRELDEDYGGAIYIDLPAAWYHDTGSLTLTGGTFSANQGWGISVAQAAASVTGVTFEGNSRSGLIDFGGSTLVDGNTFTGSVEAGNFGALCAYQSNGMVVRDNDFIGNDAGDMESEYTDSHGNEYLWVYHDEGLDLFAYDSTLTVEGNRFQDGDRGVYLSTSVADLVGNSFTGYREAAIYTYGEEGKVVSVEDTTMDNFAGYVVSGSYGRLEVSGLTATEGTISETTYDFYYNGKLQYTSTYSNSYNATYFYGSDVVFEDVSIEGAAGGGLYAYDSSLELDNVAVRGACAQYPYYNAVELYWYNEPVEVYADGLVVEAPASGHGVYLYTSASSFTAADFTDLVVTGAPSCGVSLQQIGAEGSPALFEDLDVSGSTAQGLCLSSAWAEVSGGSFGGNAGGIAASGGGLSVTSATVEANQGDGIAISGSVFALTDTVVTLNTGDGIDLSSAVASLTANTITDNGGWGITCRGTGIDVCDGNVISGNAAGDVDACEACTEASGGGDDTGL